jgi:hypothetical protein
MLDIYRARAVLLLYLLSLRLATIFMKRGPLHIHTIGFSKGGTVKMIATYPQVVFQHFIKSAVS